MCDAVWWSVGESVAMRWLRERSEVEGDGLAQVCSGQKMEACDWVHVPQSRSFHW